MKTATDNPTNTCNSETAFVYLDEPIFGRTDTNDDGDITDEEDKSYYYTTNNLYSVAALLDPDGNIIERYEYLPYGKVTVYTGPGVDEEWFTADDVEADYSEIQTYTFTGRSFDPESGLFYFRARMYSPELGRFLQRDPIGYRAGLNLHVYVHGRPTYFTDAFGLDVIDLIWTGKWNPSNEVSAAAYGTIHFSFSRTAAATTNIGIVVYKGWRIFADPRPAVKSYQFHTGFWRCYRAGRQFSEALNYEEDSFEDYLYGIAPFGDYVRDKGWVDSWKQRYQATSEDTEFDIYLDPIIIYVDSDDLVDEEGE